jgi:hypothetical protein
MKKDFPQRFIQALREAARGPDIDRGDQRLEAENIADFDGPSAASVLFGLDTDLLREFCNFREAVGAAADEVQGSDEDFEPDDLDPQDDPTGPYWHLFRAWHDIADCLSIELKPGLLDPED